MAFFVPEYLDIVSESQLYDIINEEYFYNSDLAKMEKLIGELRKKYYYSKATAINTDPLVREISDLFEKIFGFSSFQLIVEQTVRSPNAYTVPLSSKVDKWNYKKCVRKTKDGLQFTPIAKVNVIAHITTSLLLDNKYTDREIVAVLLHEIGHNFSDSINNTLGIFSNIKKVLFIPFAIMNPIQATNIGTKANINWNEWMRKNNPGLVSCFNSLQLFMGGFQYVLLNVVRFLSLNPGAFVGNLVNTFNNLIKQFIYNPIGVLTNTVFKFFGKEDEYVSDSFVAMYGYGPDLTSALMKLERTNPTFIDDMMKDSEFGAAYFAVIVEFVDYISILLQDNHPSNANRVLNALDVLEQEYNKPYINPKTKKAIKEDIAEIRELIEKEKRDNSFDGNKWRIEWNKYVFYNKPDRRPKEKMVKELIDKIDHLEEIKN